MPHSSAQMRIQSSVSPWFFSALCSEERSVFSVIFSLCVNVTIMFSPRRCISVFGSKTVWWVCMYLSLFSESLPLRVSFSVLARSQVSSPSPALASLPLPREEAGDGSTTTNHVVVGTAFSIHRAREQVPKRCWNSCPHPALPGQVGQSLHLLRTGLKSQALALPCYSP